MTSDAEQPPPGVQMVQLLGGFQVAQAVFVVAEMGIATVLEQEGSLPVQTLAERVGGQVDAVRRLIRALAPQGLFVTNGDAVSITPLGALLSEQHPHSLHAAALMWQQTHYLPFSELGHSVRHGSPGAEKYTGLPFFDYIGQTPQRAELFARAMASVTAGMRTGMFDGYRMPGGEVIADLGGGDGSMLVELLRRDGVDTRRGIVFELPSTVAAAERTIAAAGLADRVEVIAGDFFTAVPAADVYLLSFVLHDWNDEESRRLLASVLVASQPGARLLIVEGVLPEGDVAHPMKMLDLTMLGMMTGKERTELEYRTLLDDAGFTLDCVVSTSGPFSFLEATRR
jgi:hypothetical protein